jgi:hypothetical protein
MSARATPPAYFDEHALEAARRIASVDRARLKGGDDQFKAFVQVTIVDAMLFASAYAREPHVTVKGNSIMMSPAMPMADHEMDVLRAIASRLKGNGLNADDDGQSRPLSAHAHAHRGSDATRNGRVWTEPVEEKAR